MNDGNFKNRIKQDLNYNLGRLSPKALTRLKQARESALEAMAPESVSSSQWAMAGNDTHGPRYHWFTNKWLVVVLLLALTSVVYWQSLTQHAEEDVDWALLADDLPINALIDHDFHQWLEHSPQP